MSLYRDVFYDSADGLRLHARDYGDEHAPLAVLCLPGLSRNARDFEPVAERLAKRFRLICAEQRGRGQSAYDPKPENYHPGTYVGDMVTLLDHLRLPKVAILGTSLGGLMAMILAAGWPDRVAGIVINDVGPEVAAEGLAKIQSYIDRITDVSTWDEAAAEVRTLSASVFPDYGPAEWERMARQLYVEDGSGKLVLDYDAHIADTIKNIEPQALSIWPVFDGIQGIPFGLLRGALSNILSPAVMAEMKKRRPDIVSAEIPQVGHAPNLDEAASRAVIDQVLGAIPAR